MTKARLSIIPFRAATDRSLKGSDLRILCLLGRHVDRAGWCSRSQVKMAKEIGCSRSTIFRAINRLVWAGYVECYVQEADNGRDGAHLYHVIFEDAEHPADIPAPPAGLSAPPAHLEPAPPARPKPAAKNDPFRTTPSKRIERERVRERGGESRQEPSAGTRVPLIRRFFSSAAEFQDLPASNWIAVSDNNANKINCLSDRNVRETGENEPFLTRTERIVCSPPEPCRHLGQAVRGLQVALEGTADSLLFSTMPACPCDRAAPGVEVAQHSGGGRKVTGAARLDRRLPEVFTRASFPNFFARNKPK
ncbi:helix-turn-helix domain-containing protein [Mesorhizobium sp. M2E.F.Ca.ET.209.01.1.1]|nr:helix-turn-helix domain-containing protein [Mesorhizobium sp. M2E.F.Ca.ET.209.01.1.1]